MKNRIVLASSTLVAGAIALALILRPAGSISPELPAPQNLPGPVRAVIKNRMERHGAQLTELIARVVVLDFDEAARVAGAIHDEPTLARPMQDDELNRMLPAEFFLLQDALRAQAKRVVEAAARRDTAQLAEAFGALTRSCVTCHQLYLRAGEVPPTAAVR